MTTFWDSYFCLRQLVAQQVVPKSAPSIQHATHLTLVPRVDSCCHYDDIPHHKPLNINANVEKNPKRLLITDANGLRGKKMLRKVIGSLNQGGKESLPAARGASRGCVIAARCRALTD